MTLTSDELFDALGVALRPPPVEPSPGELAALHRMIDERCHDRVTARVPAMRAWARPFVVAAAAAGIVVGSGAAAVAAGAPVPRPIRAVAHDVGLPVDSPELTDAKSAASELRIVLGVNDTATIKRVRARLSRKLAEVPRDERGEIERDAKALLARADQQLRTVESTHPAAGDDSPKSGGTARAVPSPMPGPPRQDPEARDPVAWPQAVPVPVLPRAPARARRHFRACRCRVNRAGRQDRRCRRRRRHRRRHHHRRRCHPS